jgi:NADPH-dependent curcumin reductase CurA
LKHLRKNVSNYNLSDQAGSDGLAQVGLSVEGLFLLIGRQIKMQGFLVSAYPDFCREYALKAPGWIAEGKHKSRVTIAEGIENAPASFLGLFKGENTGKQLVALSSEERRSGK